MSPSWISRLICRHVVAKGTLLWHRAERPACRISIMSGGPRRSTNWPTTGSHANSQSRQFNTDTNFLGQSEHDETDIFLDNSQEHAVVSTFDLFSVGIGPSSSHTVGPMRAGNIFVNDIIAAGLFQRVHKIFVTIYGSLALTGEGHMTPSALLLGLESANVETVDTAYVPARFEQIKVEKKLHLGHGLPGGKGKEITFDYSKDFRWEWGKKLPLHSNGMRLMVFDKDGTLLATNDYFSIGGGFVVNGKLSTATNAVDARTSWSPTAGNEKATQVDNEAAVLTENVFYKEIQGSNVVGDRKKGVKIQNYDEDVNTPTEMVQAADGGEGNLKSNSGPHYPFRDARSLLSLCRKHNLTIAQLVYENEKSQGYTDEQIYDNLMRLWEVMDTSISDGVQAPINGILPGALKVHRRAPALYRTLRRGLHSSQIEATAVAGRMQEQSSSSSNVNGAENQEAQDVNERAIPGSTYSSPDPDVSTHKRPSPTNVLGMLNHQIMPSLQRYTGFLAMEYLTVYAMAVNETNAGGGRVVTAPTNGAAGIIPAVLKYTLEFISEDKERDICNFLLTAAAIGMLYKRGATISAAEGGCMAEVGVACSMAAGAFAACMGASPETIEQAAEIGIEHNLGLTCDPIGGLVQAPCIERNALGAIKAISSANLALNSHPGTQKVTLDDAIRAMRLTAQGMRTEFKETSLSGLATSVSFDIPVSVPDC